MHQVNTQIAAAAADDGTAVRKRQQSADPGLLGAARARMYMLPTMANRCCGPTARPAPA